MVRHRPSKPVIAGSSPVIRSKDAVEWRPFFIPAHCPSIDSLRKSTSLGHPVRRKASLFRLRLLRRTASDSIGEMRKSPEA